MAFKKITATIIVTLLIIGGFVVAVEKLTKKSANRGAIIKEMRSLQRLETASFTVEKIIDKGSGGNVFQQILFGDKILLIAHGQVIAGFDLSDISEKDIQLAGSRIRVILPKPEILSVSLDNTQTKVYDRSRGILNPGNKNLESEAREAAEIAIRDAACQGGILMQAAQNARKQLTAFLAGFGFISVSVDIPDGSC